MTPKVSVIIPVYNTDIRKIKRCLHSVEQLMKHTEYAMECIIIDDGSDDYIERFFQNKIINNKKYIYVKKNNGGVSTARNTGIEKANGKYILFVDADDALFPEQTAGMLDRYLNENKDIIFSDLIYKKMLAGKNGRLFHLAKVI